MKALSSSALIDLSIDIDWQNKGIAHQDHYFAGDLNCWRDAIPGSPIAKLLENKEALNFSMDVHPGTLVPEHDTGKILNIPASCLNGHKPDYFKKGRYYPQGILSGVPGIFKTNMTPFRCFAVDSRSITADMNHPMATFAFKLTLNIHGRSIKPEERGGACTDWLEIALTGVGMQARYGKTATDFFTARAFDRRDATPDDMFYAKDRLVSHIDAKAGENLSEIYRGLIAPGAKVLDLMAGYESHLPEDLEFQEVHGLGLNKNELQANERLDSFSIQDLNTNPHLNFQDQIFDAVICALSVEYLVKPAAVFNEVARVLKPGGNFIVAFSNRWFPEKTIRIWENLHDFERMGLVIEYFKQVEIFDGISTLSRRGYPRPYDDKYYPRIMLSDPVYAVAAIRNAED